jgi:hypothetical protein
VIMACTVLVIAYIFFERRVPEVYKPKKGSQSTQLKGLGRWKFAIVSITQLYVTPLPHMTYLTNRPMFFWILCGTGESTPSSMVNQADD